MRQQGTVPEHHTSASNTNLFQKAPEHKACGLEWQGPPQRTKELTAIILLAWQDDILEVLVFPSL